MWALHCLGDQFMPKMWISALGGAHSSTALMAATQRNALHRLRFSAIAEVEQQSCWHC